MGTTIIVANIDEKNTKLPRSMKPLIFIHIVLNLVLVM